jgi:hypothetical protein
MHPNLACILKITYWQFLVMAIGIFSLTQVPIPSWYWLLQRPKIPLVQSKSALAVGCADKAQANNIMKTKTLFIFQNCF